MGQSKKVLVFGATGLVGRSVVTEVLKTGNTVAVYIRQESYPVAAEILTGALDDESRIRDAIRGADVVVSAVGNRNYEDPTRVVAPLVQRVARHLAKEQRFIVVSGSGLTLADARTLRRDLPGQPAFLVHQRADHWEAYCHLAPLDLDYLFICPTSIVEGGPDGNYVVAEKYFPQSTSKKVLAGNVAHFIAQEIASPSFRQTRIGIVDR